MFVRHAKPGRKKPGTQGDVPAGRPPPVVAADGKYTPTGAKKV